MLGRSATMLVFLWMCMLVSQRAVRAVAPAKDAPLAIARITGPLICTHCDLGIGDQCRAGIQIEDAVFVLAGKANDQLLDLRLSGGVRRVIGVLSVQDGYLHLSGVNDQSLAPKAKSEMLVTGRVIKSGKQLALAHGKTPIVLRGKVDGLQGQPDKWVEVQGTLDVDRKGRIRMTAKTSKTVGKPPGPPK